ncbi:protease complex subunit PrcB family protein [Flavobacterium circumlabens]|uniref:Protease complex subunit PrcB family protein n=1 Tax=Flavobacterium circumlabens TaxID=2133765 RepID=A0A4Y7UD57_9FLAO|nr:MULTISPECIES: protease complex subunit PrcB family protein [Flavobacterium]QSB28662.1 protease complex subunit PrcB family protein [Flavobacterium sp. CLA17]TCN58962.1 protease stability complex PrcB-like protein [Flavobacterium circumlabens]TEB44365.1 protease complex subunit PrcB family protein [Flavobacterium circumlabens]
MKKVISVLAVFALVSCGVQKTSDSKALYEILTVQSDGGGNIRFFEILTEPNEIKMLENDPLLKDKMKQDDITNSNYVILNMGEKNTGGYSIGIDKVEETDKNIIITVKETNPAPDSMTMQVITYPYTVVKIRSKKEIIIK